MRVCAGAICLGVLAVALSGCLGYSHSSMFREDIRTVYVEFFDNRTFRRELEPQLTRAVVEEIRLRTPLRFAPRAEADSILAGELMGVDERTRVKSATDAVLVRSVTVHVRFSWQDRRTGAFIVPEQVVSESAQIAPPAEDPLLVGTFDPTVQRAETPFDLVFLQAARRIVDKMESNW